MIDSIFELFFPDDILLEGRENAVLCPFPHSDIDGTKYLESHASAHINLDKGLFHCKTCYTGKNELQFVEAILNLNTDQARSFMEFFKKSRDLDEWEKFQKNLIPNIKNIEHLNYSDKAIADVKLGYTGRGAYSIPIIMYGRYCGNVTNYPNQQPKYRLSTGTMAGLPIPFDDFIKPRKNKNVIICAGEKDMITLKSLMPTSNIISITGGEQTLPILFKEYFRDKNIYIVYDNDPAGRKGSRKLANFLFDIANKVHIVDISKTCIEEKEDVWDYFNKYNKSKDDFKALLKSSKQYTQEDIEKELEKKYPLVSIEDAMNPTKFLDKTVRIKIDMPSIYNDIFEVSTSFTATKMMEDKSDVRKGQQFHWNLNEETLVNILELGGPGIKADDIFRNKLGMAGVSKKEKYMEVQDHEKKIISMCHIADKREERSDETKPPSEITAYVIGNKKPKANHSYIATGKVVGHPREGNVLVFVITELKPLENTLDEFKLTDEVKLSLDKFKANEDLVAKMKELFDRKLNMFDMEAELDMIKLIDLTYHSALQFNFGSTTHRGTIDSLIIGGSRIGKSFTSRKFMKLYDIGKLIPLGSATSLSIIGGSDKDARNRNYIKVGVLPNSHKSLVIFEELAKMADKDFLKKLTEIRSSGVTKISRVSGTVEVDSLVRMITLTNPKSKYGDEHINIDAYNNGVELLNDITGTVEDANRYDMIGIFNGEQLKDLSVKDRPPLFDEVDYQRKIRWIWSRKPNQIIIDDELQNYISRINLELSDEYDATFKVFGTDGKFKIIRFATAVAGFVASTDSTYENIIVKKEHVDYAVDLMLSIYNNDTFNLKEYCAEYKKANIATEEDINYLQGIYNQNPEMIKAMRNKNTFGSKQLRLSSTLSDNEFTRLIGVLNDNKFIELTGRSEIKTTVKFKKAVKKIDLTKKGSLNFGVKNKMDKKT